MFVKNNLRFYFFFIELVENIMECVLCINMNTKNVILINLFANSFLDWYANFIISNLHCSCVYTSFHNLFGFSNTRKKELIFFFAYKNFP